MSSSHQTQAAHERRSTIVLTAVLAALVIAGLGLVAARYGDQIASRLFTQQYTAAKPFMAKYGVSVYGDAVPARFSVQPDAAMTAQRPEVKTLPPL